MDVQPLPIVDEKRLVLLEKLGEGASGIVWSADWDADSTGNTRKVAIKIFKGSVTSDGLPTDEVKIFSKLGGATFDTESVVDRSKGIKPLPCVLGQTTVDNQLAVVLNLIPKDFQTLGNPPNFNTCTRDTFPEGFVLNMSALLSIVRDIMRAMCIMHDLHVAHGDLYAHNIMFGGSDSETVAATLCDFGASTYYHGINKCIADKFERIEVLAFGNLLEDLSSIVQIEDEAEESVLQQLQKIQRQCQDHSVSSRPSMSWLKQFISKLP
jgi:serine/threonine protein kinase